MKNKIIIPQLPGFNPISSRKKYNERVLENLTIAPLDILAIGSSVPAEFKVYPKLMLSHFPRSGFNHSYFSICLDAQLYQIDFKGRTEYRVDNHTFGKTFRYLVYSNNHNIGGLGYYADSGHQEVPRIHTGSSGHFSFFLEVSPKQLVDIKGNFLFPELV